MHKAFSRNEEAGAMQERGQGEGMEARGAGGNMSGERKGLPWIV